MKDIDEKTQVELEAAAFRRLVGHLRERTDVQNIDLMNLAGFCRNCLSNWLKEAADERASLSPKEEPDPCLRHALRGMEGAPPARGLPSQAILKNRSRGIKTASTK